MAKAHLYSPALRAQYGAASAADVVEVPDEAIDGILAAGVGCLAETGKAEKAVSKKAKTKKKAVREP